MKNILQIVCMTLLFTACSNKKSEAIPTVVIKGRYLPVLKGTWVAKDYIDDIAGTKSPEASYSKLQGVAAFIIADKFANGKIAGGISLSNHEEKTFSVFPVKGVTANSLKSSYHDFDTNDAYDVDYAITATDTIIILRGYNNGKPTMTKKFVRVNSNTTVKDMGRGIQFTVNKQLIAGTYNVEGTEQPLTVTFKNNGSVTGFEGFDSYLVGTDFAVNDPDEFPGKDYIYFEKKGDGNYFSYDFKIKADTLKLSQHATQYKLVKQHKL